MQSSSANTEPLAGRHVNSSVNEQHFEAWQANSKQEQRYWKLLGIPNRIRSAILLSRWAPWAVYLPYLAFEWILKNSPRTRGRWSEHLKSKPRSNIKKLEQNFPYQDLGNEDSIRLLSVLPDTDIEPLSCTISHHRLDDSPSYVAISYSWVDGQDSKPGILKCGQHEILVQDTIFQLLRRMRKTDQPVVLWIDAICINQADPSERACQVEMMGRIYGSASLVVVWVGEEDDRSARLAQFIDETARKLESGQSIEGERLWRLSVEWTDLAIFLERPWFRRTWVLQEVCLAQRCMLRCGPYCWSWQTLELVFDRLVKLNVDDVPGAARRLNQGVIQFSRHWKDVRSRSTVSIAQLLSATRGTFASVPVDKVYGILSLADDRLGIRVNYEADVREVFKNVAKRLLARGASEVLTAASDNVWNDTSGLSTWVPDWACVNKPTSLSASRDRTILSGVQLHEAEAESVPDAAIDLKEGLLRLHVLAIDRVNGIGVPWPGNGHEQNPTVPDNPLWEIGPSAAPRLEQWYTMLPQYMKGDRHRYASTGEPPAAALMRTMVADSTRMPSCCSKWEELYPAFKDRLDWLRRFNVARFHSNFWYHQQEDPMAEYHNAVKALCHKRTLFFTRQGSMGLGPFNTLPFDRIFVVPGLHFPVVMRKTMKGRYKLIGECYIHGWKRPANVRQYAEIVIIE